VLSGLNGILSRIQDIETRFNVSPSNEVAFAKVMEKAQQASGKATSNDGNVETILPETPACRHACRQTGQAQPFADEILESSKKYDLDPALVKAVISVESGFKSTAKSHAGAMGLMQLMPSTARGLGVTDPFNPAQNIDAGCRYLKIQLDRFGDIKLALAAYNAGPGNVKKYGGIPPFAETQRYVKKVLSRWEDYK